MSSALVDFFNHALFVVVLNLGIIFIIIVLLFVFWILCVSGIDIYREYRYGRDLDESKRV